jgi:hypothetical protein
MVSPVLYGWQLNMEKRRKIQYEQEREDEYTALSLEHSRKDILRGLKF